MRIIVGITGASGVVMGYHLIRALKTVPDTEIFLVVSEAARCTWQLETDLSFDHLTDQADHVYDENDLGAVISSGSFVTDGMIIMPCSMKTLAGIVSGYAENLIQRCADVCLKENRRLVLVPREMPLGRIHLRNMKDAADLGCVIIPPMLTFYSGAATIEEQIDHIIGKILLQFGISYKKFVPWKGNSDPTGQNSVSGRDKESF